MNTPLDIDEETNIMQARIQRDVIENSLRHATNIPAIHLRDGMELLGVDGSFVTVALTIKQRNELTEDGIAWHE